VWPAELALPASSELDEAWQRLDLFPIESIKHINALRRLGPLARRTLEGQPTAVPLEIKLASTITDKFLKAYDEVCRHIVEAGQATIDEINEEIARES
jgi:hypothetical protein